MEEIKRKLRIIREIAETKKVMAAVDLLDVLELIVKELDPDIDCKALLKKYINHVEDCEGTDFIDQITPGFARFGGQVFSEKELKLLNKLRVE